MAKIKSILCLCSILLICSCSHFSKKPDYSVLDDSEYGEAAPTYGTKSVGDPWSAANHNELYSSLLALYQVNGILNCNGSSSCSPALNSDINTLLGVQFTGTYAVASIPGSPSSGDVILINDGDSPCDTSIGSGSYKYFLRYNGASWDCLGDGSVWWSAQTSAPSHDAGRYWVADSDNWNPCSSDSTTDYIVLDNGTTFLPVCNIDGSVIVQTAAPGTPITGWYYWADANGTWDPDTEVSGTDPYKVYWNGSGYISIMKLNGTVLSSTEHTKCTTIAGATASSDYMVEQLPYAITIRSARVTQRGATNVVGHFDECDSAGASCAGIDGATDITATTTQTDDGSLSNPSIDANDVIQWHTTSVSGTNTDCIVCINYTIDN